jgi:hypothetical protein
MPRPAISLRSRASDSSIRRAKRIAAVLKGPVATYAHERAQALAEDHARVRTAAAGTARVTVEPIVPTDVIGVYVLVPAVQ